MIFTVEQAAAKCGDDALADSVEFQRLCAAVDADIKAFFGKKLERQQHVEYPRSYGMRNSYEPSTLFLAEGPIDTIDEIRIDVTGGFADGTEIDLSSGINIDHESNCILLRNVLVPAGRHVVRVTYTAGYYATDDDDPSHASAIMPHDLVEFAVERVAKLNELGSSEEVRSESLGALSLTRYDGPFTPWQQMIVNRYRRWFA
jgi:hypothetical protein